MASVSVLPPSPSAPPYYSIDHLRKPASATSSFVGTIIPPIKNHAFHSSQDVPSNYDSYDFTTTSTTPPGAAIGPKTASTHAKLHKKATTKPTRRGSKAEDIYQVDNTISRTRTPPSPPQLASYSLDHQLIAQAQKSPSKQAKEIFKQNLRKLSHAPEDDHTGSIDLSKTAEENERRAGLGLTGVLRNSRSADVLQPAGGPSYRGHSRSYSHNSQVANIPYQPTAPFVYPMLYTPATTYTFDSPQGGTDYAPRTYQIPEETTGRSRGNTVDSANSSEKRPGVRVNLSRYASSSQTNLAKAGLTRPRRSSTNHSIDTMAGKSRTSIDRAFTFGSRGKEETIDPVSRAATIQAARQAFDDRQEAKARKYEEKEQRAVERMQRKQSREAERQRRKSEASRTRKGSRSPEIETAAPTSFSQFPEMAEKPNFASGGEYADIRPSTSRSGRAPTEREDTPAEEKQYVPPVTRKRAAKSTYFRFLSWLKTKILNLGRK